MKKDGLKKHQNQNTKARTSESLNNTNPKEKTMLCLNRKFSSETLTLNLAFFFVHGAHSQGFS
jgi:hypothetical protein